MRSDTSTVWGAIALLVAICAAVWFMGWLFGLGFETAVGL
jgi:high-affinity nickel permease